MKKNFGLEMDTIFNPTQATGEGWYVYRDMFMKPVRIARTVHYKPRFATDADAHEYVVQRAIEGSKYHDTALMLVNARTGSGEQHD